MNNLLRFLGLLTLPALAIAHPGHETPGWFGGLLHPLVGFDHPLGFAAWLVGALLAAWVVHRLGVWCARQMVLLARWLGSSLREAGLVSKLPTSHEPPVQVGAQFIAPLEAAVNPGVMNHAPTSSLAKSLRRAKSDEKT